MGERKYDEFRYEGKYDGELAERCTSIYKATYICVYVYTHTHTHTERSIRKQAKRRSYICLHTVSI